ncbi:MAG: serine hydrolase domain-containing protein [Pseudomonadota bacterium]
MDIKLPGHSLRQTALLTAILTLAACGGGGSDTAPVVSGPQPDPWAPVISELETSSLDNLVLIVGTAEGEQFRYEKGQFGIDTVYPIASASKWLTGATILQLVQQGVMALDDRPQDYLDYWSSDPNDARSRITLEMLLSFTAGFHIAPLDPNCTGDEQLTVQTCAAAFYADGVDAEPGTTFYYGPAHMQVAAAMAEVATGQSWRDVVELTIAAPLNLANTGFEGDNPKASGGANSTTNEYAEFIRAQLRGDLLPAGLLQLTAERTAALGLMSRPAAVEGATRDWQYGLGVWRECNRPEWDAVCEAATLVSSAGAFGWYPWLDVDRGYYAVLGRNASVGFGRNPAADSVNLGARLQPLIHNALSAASP